MSLRLIYPLILSLIILSTPLAAFWEEAGLEIKAAYFHPNSNRVRKIYDNDWADIQIEATQRFCQNWQAWAGIS